MLSVSNLTKSYGSTKALDDVSFEVEKGSIVGFLGPNGAGKTTTLRILTGFLQQDSGEISYNKTRLKFHTKELLSNIGYLPENNPLYKNLRVDEFLIFISRLKGISTDGLEDITQECGLENVLRKEIDTLSKGYKQRVGLAKALVGDPDFLLLDEPTEGLDPNQKDKIYKLITSYAKDRTILFSSHVLSEVTEIADKVIIINNGKIIASGKSDDLVKEHFKNAEIIVKTDAPVKILRSKIEKINTIFTIKSFSKGRSKFYQYKIACSNPDETALEIFKVIVKNKWNCIELHTQSHGLEELFKDLTQD